MAPFDLMKASLWRHVRRFTLLPQHIRSLTMYRYKPLDETKREIRLLNIVPKNHPARITRKAITCTIFSKSLDERPNYCALSYTWGGPGKKFLITVNGAAFQVTENLYQALEHLEEGGDELLTFWIDAICINQNDVREKMHQVQQMRDVFQGARQVIAWLGPEKESSSIALLVLNLIGQLGYDHGYHNGSGKNPTTAEEWDYFFSQVLSIFKSRYYYHKDPYFAVLHFFKRPFWQRIWIVQEIAVGRSVWFRCGQDGLPWERLSNAYIWLCKLLEYSRSAEQGGFTSKDIDNFRVNIEEVELGPNVMDEVNPITTTLQRQELHQVTLAELLAGTTHGDHKQGLKATDPRDMIFALLGIAADTEELQIYPDYSKTREEVYTEAAKKLLARNEPTFLNICQSPEARQGLPSWVYNWAAQATTERILRNPKRRDIPNFTAAKDSTISVHFPEMVNGRDICEISGIRIDTISHLGPTWNPSLNISDFATWFAAAAQLFSHASDSLPASSDSRIANIIMRVAIADERLDTTHNKAFPDSTELLRLGYDLLRGSAQPDEDLEDKEMWLNATTLPFRELMNVKARDRRPFVTNKGFMGLGRAHAKVGDLAVILFGVNVPMILTPVEGGRFRLIGDAYVDGIMYGEYFEGRREENEVFSLE